MTYLSNRVHHPALVSALLYVELSSRRWHAIEGGGNADVGQSS